MKRKKKLKILKHLLFFCKNTDHKYKIHFCNILSTNRKILRELGLRKAAIELNGDVSHPAWHRKGYLVFESDRKYNKWKIKIVKLAIKNLKQ